EANAVTHNPVRGVKRPRAETAEGKTPAIASGQARRLLEAPPEGTLKGKRDRAILAVLFFHGLRREELCKLRVKDVEQREGVPHLRVHGKGGKVRFVPAHPAALMRISKYLEACGHGNDGAGALFRPVKNPHGHGKLDRALTPGKVDECVVRYYSKRLGVSAVGFGPHVARATAATHALNQGADIAKVQEWLGHANIATTRIYDRRRSRPEDSPTFRMNY
ncbi:MAG: tyrosine-type recombinase/integrase, partial [Rhodospirillales bacterium]|nr:tyrosine-type recombinase/integrase [Acetobacter sp.]